MTPPVFALQRARKDAGLTRRLLALAAIYDGASRSEAAGIGDVTLRIIREWVVKLNAHCPDSVVDYKGPGPQLILTKAHQAAVATAIEDGPMPAIHGVCAAGSSTSFSDVGRVSGLDVQADAGARAARDGISQGVGPPRHHAQAVEAIELLKGFRRAPGRDRARGGCQARRYRSLVAVLPDPPQTAIPATYSFFACLDPIHATRSNSKLFGYGKSS